MTLPDFLTRLPEGAIRLTGHRIGLDMVIRPYREGQSAEQIAEELPSLGLALVYKALAFYLENRAEVDAYVDACDAEMDRLEAAYTPGPGILRLKRLKEQLHQADAQYGSDPAWASLDILAKLRRIGALPPADPV